MKRVLLWIWDHWYLAILLVGAVLTVVWLRGRGLGDLKAKLALELAAIRAKEEARNATIELGAEKARQQVEAKYRSDMIKLDADQKAEAERLKDDPVALAAFLVRAGGFR